MSQVGSSAWLETVYRGSMACVSMVGDRRDFVDPGVGGGRGGMECHADTLHHQEAAATLPPGVAAPGRKIRRDNDGLAAAACWVAGWAAACWVAGLLPAGLLLLPAAALLLVPGGRA